MSFFVCGMKRSFYDFTIQSLAHAAMTMETFRYFFLLFVIIIRLYYIPCLLFIYVR